MKNTISNNLLLASITTTIITYIIPDFVIFGMNRYYLFGGNYLYFGLQILFYQFIHSGILHLLSNSLFIYIFGNQVELLIGKKKYIIFFLLNTIFVAISLLLFSSGNTVGISGFGLAILSFVYFIMKKSNHPDYRGAGVFLIINILIGFTSNISFVGHFAGAIFGLIFFQIINLTKK